MSLSFPYFSIAQELGVSYAKVLALVDFIEKHGIYDPIFDQELYCHVENAVLTEYERRRIVHDAPLDQGSD
jgi:hypothetical protein